MKLIFKGIVCRQIYFYLIKLPFLMGVVLSDFIFLKRVPEEEKKTQKKINYDM